MKGLLMSMNENTPMLKETKALLFSDIYRLMGSWPEFR